MQELKPVLNLEQLQQKANEYAQKGAEETIKEFYCGYNSPYKKAIEEDMKHKAVVNNFDIPDIIAVLNQKISTEIDMIANTAIAKTFIPLIKNFLVREEAEIKFSDILRKFIEFTNFDYDDCEISNYEVNKITDRHSSNSLNEMFPTYKITNGKIGFEIHFHKDKEKATIMSLPYSLTESGKYYREFERNDKMKLSIDGGVTLELPFVRGVLDNDFIRYCARIIIGNCNVIFDVEDFDEDMFPEEGEDF